MTMYIKRCEIDTNSSVIRLLKDNGEVDDHWAYLADDYVATTSFHNIPAYEGGIMGLTANMRNRFEQGNYLIDEEKITAAKILKEESITEVTLADRLRMLDLYGLF